MIYDFFFNVQKKIAKNISEDKAAILLHELYQVYTKTKKYGYGHRYFKNYFRLR